MTVAATVFATAGALGRALAPDIVVGIEAARREARPYVLGCPGGRSPKTTYAALAMLVRARRTDLTGVVIAMMDDYVEPDGAGGFRRVSASAPHSCRRFGQDHIVGPLSLAAVAGRGIRAENFWVPDPRDPGAYDDRLAAVGGFDLFLLASGASDGHVAFNPPGSPRDSGSRVVELAESTRRDNLVTFPTLRTLDQVPTHGVTVGIDTIARHAKRAVLIAIGDDKQRTVQRLVSADEYAPDWPATVLVECSEPSLFMDTAAAGVAPLDFARNR